MRIDIDNVRGFQDNVPPNSLKKEKVKEVIENKCKNYGYLPIESPLLEYDELAKTDFPMLEEDEATASRFRLRDKSTRTLAIRHDFIYQLPRLMRQHPSRLPLRWYQIGPLLRDEPSGTLKFRQYTQAEISIIGDSSIVAELECLSIAADIIKELKIDAEIQVNNTKLLRSIIESVQIVEREKLIKELALIDRIGEDQLKTNLRKYADTNQIMTIFKLFEKDIGFFKDNAFDGVEELSLLIETSKLYGLNLKFNPFVIRNQGYYTGNIFEIKTPDKTKLAGGGRYDKTAGKFIEQKIAAAGISLSIERLMHYSKIEFENPTKIILISLDKPKETLDLARKLRDANINTLVSFDKAGTALEQAVSLQISYSVFVGAEEVEKKKFKLRNIQTQEEKIVTEKQLIKNLL